VITFSANKAGHWRQKAPIFATIPPM